MERNIAKLEPQGGNANKFEQNVTRMNEHNAGSESELVSKLEVKRDITINNHDMEQIERDWKKKQIIFRQVHQKQNKVVTEELDILINQRGQTIKNKS